MRASAGSGFLGKVPSPRRRSDRRHEQALLAAPEAGLANRQGRRLTARSCARREAAIRDPPPLLVGGLHIAALTTFALAQPLFDLLGRNPEFFVAHDSTRWDIVLFAVALTLVPPLALVLLEALVLPAGRTPRAALHLLLVGGLTAVIALEALRRLDGSTAILIAAAAVVGATAAAAYARVVAMRSFLTLLSLAAPVFVALFLFQSPVSHLVLSGGGEARPAVGITADAPVVMVSFDEFPLMSLLDHRGLVDGRRFPAFGDLARHATWFRNADASSDETLHAVPAILSGTFPHKGQLPIASDYPKNLFTLLGGRYHLEVFEAVTHLCPRTLCKEEPGRGRLRTRVLASDAGIVYLHVLLPDRLASRLPSISEGWSNFQGADVGRPTAPTPVPGAPRPTLDSGRVLAEAFSTNRLARFDGFIAAIQRSDRQPTLYFAHMLLPHRPWAYLPSGRQYGNAVAVFGTGSGIWPEHEDWLLTQAYRRYLLQLGFADRMLGRLFAQLRATGLYDRSLIVITADHGIAFRAGQPLRGIRPSNIADIAPVPLFVKAPHQRRGRIVDTPVQTVDIVPTIADILGIQLPWDLDGRSALAPGAGRRVARVVKTSGDVVSAPTKTIAHHTRHLAARWTSIFGEHTDEEALLGVGPRSDLVGKRIAALDVERATMLTATLNASEDRWLRSVDLHSSFVPANVTGRIVGPSSRTGLTLALAVNGRIAALTESFELRGAIQFEELVPESAFRNGANDAELYLVSSTSQLEHVPWSS